MDSEQENHRAGWIMSYPLIEGGELTVHLNVPEELEDVGSCTALVPDGRSSYIHCGKPAMWKRRNGDSVVLCTPHFVKHLALESVLSLHRDWERLGGEQWATG